MPSEIARSPARCLYSLHASMLCRSVHDPGGTHVVNLRSTLVAEVFQGAGLVARRLTRERARCEACVEPACADRAESVARAYQRGEEMRMVVGNARQGSSPPTVPSIASVRRAEVSRPSSVATMPACRCKVQVVGIDGGSRLPMRVQPWRILAGLGFIERNEIADLLAFFEVVSLGNLFGDAVKDFMSGNKNKKGGNAKHFEARITRTADSLKRSSVETSVLRLRLWAEIRSALETEPMLPLSLRTARTATAGLGVAAATQLARRGDFETDTEENSGAAAWATRLKRVFASSKAPDFSAVVYAQLSRLLVDADRDGTIDEQEKADLLERLRARMKELPPERRDEAVEQAIANGDLASIGLLLGGGSLAGLAVTVELMGFGAFILAAKASAFIPFFSGPATVSALFVLSNPVFAVPAFLGGAAVANSLVSGRAKAQFAAGLTVMLALRSVAGEAKGLHACLDDFRTLPEEVRNDPRLAAYGAHAARVRRHLARSLPTSAGAPPGHLASSPLPATHQKLQEALFPGDNGTTAAGAVGALTLGDMAYTVAAIDPRVVLAADFSNGETIDSLLDFGLFATGRDALDGASADGAFANLQGFVAERIVASRLVADGHQVSLPSDSDQAGYDLVVDGARFQVKCVQDLAALEEHFARYPEIPVFANAELADEVAATNAEWVDRVFFVEGFERETTIDIVQRSLDAGVDLVGLDVPVFAVAVSAARNLHGWWKGRIPLSELPTEVALDGAFYGSVSAGGTLTGQTLGLLIFGPAGAVVFSGVGGVASLLLVRSARRTFDDWCDPAYRTAVGEATTQLLEALDRAVDRKRQELGWKLAVIIEPLSAEQAWLRDRLLDDEVFLAETVAAVEEVRAEKDELARAAAAMRLIPTYAVHPWAAQSEIRALSAAIESRKPLAETLAERAERVMQASRRRLMQAHEAIGGFANRIAGSRRR